MFQRCNFIDKCVNVSEHRSLSVFLLKRWPVILSEASVELDSRRRMGYYLFQMHPARILESIRLLLTQFISQLRQNTLDAACHFKTAPMITFTLEFNWSSTISLSLCVCVCVCVCVCISHSHFSPRNAWCCNSNHWPANRTAQPLLY